jgi:hypothetical protein
MPVPTSAHETLAAGRALVSYGRKSARWRPTLQLPEGYAGGPLPNATVAVCDWPFTSVQPSSTLVPGW